MIADVDKDGSGAIDYDEFYHMMTAKIGERDTKEELTKAFKIIDLDNNVSIMLSFFLSSLRGLQYLVQKSFFYIFVAGEDIC